MKLLNRFFHFTIELRYLEVNILTGNCCFGEGDGRRSTVLSFCKFIFVIKIQNRTLLLVDEKVSHILPTKYPHEISVKSLKNVKSQVSFRFLLY